MIRMLVFGLAFGFVLSRSGATNYDLIEQMFLLENLHLMGVIGTAIFVAGVGLFLVRKFNMRTLLGPADISVKPRHAGNLWGGLIFGAGWAITGACPGTALSQIGEGKLTALFTVTGIFLGTILYKKIGDKVLAFLSSKRSDTAPVGGKAAASR